MLVITTLRNDMGLIEQHYREALELRAKGAMDEEVFGSHQAIATVAMLVVAMDGLKQLCRVAEGQTSGTRS